MKRLLIPFIALALCPPATAYPQEPERKTSSDLQAEGKNCNFFQDKPITWYKHVEGKRVVRLDVMKVVNFEYTTFKGNYSSGGYKTNCSASKVQLFCIKEDCWVALNSGRYGHHPGKQNTVVIDGRRFSWIGDMPIETGRQMWRVLREGSVVKAAFFRWPSRYVDTKDVLKGVQESKNLAYQISIQGENYQLPSGR